MNYSISDLEKLSGIQSHTIRVWESRYKILKPLRTLGNTRKYDDGQLKKLLNIAILKKSGLKISHISKLSPAELTQHINHAGNKDSKSEQFEFIIAKILGYGFTFEEGKLECLLDKFIKSFGLESCYKNIMCPVLVKLGFMWLKENIFPSNEHFMVNIFRQKIISSIDTLPTVMGDKKPWLLFLPEEEQHDIGLLFAKYVLKKSDQKVIYLGANVPFADIEHVLDTVNLGAALFFITTSKNKLQTQRYFEKLCSISSFVPMYVSGNREILNNINYPIGITWMQTAAEFEAYMQNKEVS